MKKITKLIVCMALTASLMGCGQERAGDQTKGKSSNSISADVQLNQDGATQASSSDAGASSSQTASETSSASTASESESASSTSSAADVSTASSSFVANTDEAIQVLKTHLKEGQDSDISFNALGKDKKKDSTGFYYLIREESKELVERGGSGTVGIYRVYEDGSYAVN
ncbi:MULTISPECIES: hypothetical protein [Sporolactobacillus]|uniref:Lipoprotein n=2 Tax=Sporolactobacillus TaxID=2077 RepID=A0A0U1QLB2_9BACL|nr:MULTISPECIES: hypothetical protein [Sporolactobacillus]KLI01610.1 hypothetical protein SINU_12515 [Sporolactobacillus inulinus CASD]QAA21387.1 membrane protein insertase YidC [Sporolactobacillus terrae]QAA24359.1 membrane protein insertase YidC [Sporolactobacillus terrae]UAK16180.1 hypothetical protein K7399_14640 [Sporolactobacillus terrae]BBN97636.1 hypothetical protein St703_03410 [Sporolactobacillus terrae]